MLSLAVILLVVAALFGAALTTEILRRPGLPPRVLAALHGVVALAGLGVTLAALIHPEAGPSRGVATGTASFGLIAVLLLLVAALMGAAALVLHLRRRRVLGFAIGAHATVAIFGLVILAVYLLAG